MKQNAGILFYHRGRAGLELLLTRRAIHPGRGWWGGSGGKQSWRDSGDLWRTAVRETREEYGDHPIFLRACYRRTDTFMDGQAAGPLLHDFCGRADGEAALGTVAVAGSVRGARQSRVVAEAVVQSVGSGAFASGDAERAVRPSVPVGRVAAGGLGRCVRVQKKAWSKVHYHVKDAP